MPGSRGAAYASVIAIDSAGQRQYVQLTQGALVGVAAADGKVLWKYDKPANKSSIECTTPIYDDGRLYYRTESGTVLLIEPSAKEYLERGRFTQPDPSKVPAWSHPVIANGKLYIRDQDVLFCYDVKAK